MIGYLKGLPVAFQTGSNKRSLLTLEVNQVGYDLQVPGRLRHKFPPEGEMMQVFTHLNVREDQLTLFGFGSAAERDLFRQLVAVSGIGPQLALALIDTLGLQDLVQAIVSSNTRLLASTPGVGKKTAERIALELKTKLAEWREQSGVSTVPAAGPVGTVQEDVEITLMALGYSTPEIQRALQVVGQTQALAKNDQSEDWIKAAIAYLSQ